MCMNKKLRKNITVSGDTYAKAIKDASNLGLTFSAYLSFLINRK